MNSSKKRQRWRRTALAAAMTLGMIVGVTGHGPVEADQLDGVVRDITTTPTNPRPNDLIRTEVTWCIPDGSQEGDFFTITMPEQLRGFPPSFPVRDPSGEFLVAVGTIDEGPPVVATITFTDYVETRSGVCGATFFASTMNASEVAGTTQTLTYTVNGTVTFEETIEVSEELAPVRERGAKRGEWAEPFDQCRTRTENCIEWVLTSRVGPFDLITFNDVAVEGLSFSCDDVSIRYWFVNPDGTRGASFDASELGASNDVECTPEELTVATGPVPADHLVRVRIPATPDVQAPPSGADYGNIATIVHDTGDQEIVDEVGSVTESGGAGGVGAGVNVDIEKYDTNGNDADTPNESVVLPDGTASLVFTNTNSGGALLINVEVSDVVVAGGATVTGLTCDFSGAEPGAPTSGTTWAGPWAPGTQFDCTATLEGVDPDVPHIDEATIVGTGRASGETVTDSDRYHATRTRAPSTTAPPSTVAPPPTAPPTTPPLSVVTLPKTGSSPGSMTGLAVGLLAAGALLAGLAVRRPRRET